MENVFKLMVFKIKCLVRKFRLDLEICVGRIMQTILERLNYNQKVYSLD